MVNLFLQSLAALHLFHRQSLQFISNPPPHSSLDISTSSFIPLAIQLNPHSPHQFLTIPLSPQHHHPPHLYHRSPSISNLHCDLARLTPAQSPFLRQSSSRDGGTARRGDYSLGRKGLNWEAAQRWYSEGREYRQGRRYNEEATQRIM